MLFLLGELALLTNEFLQLDAVKNPAQPETLELLLSFLPVWDVYNPRDLAYALSRIFTILTEILPGSDPEVRRLAAALGMDISKIMIGALPLNDFIAAVFGLFAYGRQLKGPELAIFDVRRIFAKVGFPPGILRKLVADRALTATEFRTRLGGGKPRTRKAFGEELGRRSFLADSLNLFRQNPMLRLDANRVLILELDFMAELLTSGVYWNIFDTLPRERRKAFRDLWGRLFEVYSVDLLKEFYPASSRILSADLTYKGGQVDALLDFRGCGGSFRDQVVSADGNREAQRKQSGVRRRLRAEVRAQSEGQAKGPASAGCVLQSSGRGHNLHGNEARQDISGLRERRAGGGEFLFYDLFQ